MESLSSQISSNLSSEINEQITHDLKRYLNIRTVTSARFTSDGRHIVFLANITGIPQLWITEVERDDEEDDRSKMMMELLSVDNTERVSLSEITGDMLLSSKEKDLIAYGTDAGGNERHQIYVIENLGERLRKITDRPNVVHCLGNFSNDGKRICYSSNQRNQTAFDLYAQDTDGLSNSGELIYQGEGTNYPVEWSPKDNAILFKTIVAPFNHDLYLLDLSTLKVEKIVEHQDDAVFDLPTFSRDGKTIYCLTNAGREFTALAEISLADHKLQYVFEEKTSDIELLKQSPSGRYLAFTVNSNGYSKLKILSRAKRRKVVSELLLPKKSIVLDLDWSPDSSRLSLVITSSTLNTDVWTYDISKKELRRITQISASGIPRSSFQPDKEMRFKSFDSLQISSYLYLPKKKKKKEKRQRAPLLVYLHGGPESQFRPIFNPFFQYLLRLGFAVGVPNYRGSTGYGRTFTHLDDVRNRMNTVRDVESFILALKKRENLSDRIDFSKIVAFGGSYGGFMVLACLYANPEFWAAGVDIVGIANFITFLQNTSPWRRKLRIPEYGDPERDRDFLLSISPVTNAHKIKAPLFVIHGTNDPRVPIGEAEQIVSTMERLGRKVRLLKFEGEGHGLHKISDRIDAYTKAISFLFENLIPQ